MEVTELVETVGRALRSARMVRAHKATDKPMGIGLCLIRLTRLDALIQAVGVETMGLVIDEIETRLGVAARQRDEVLRFRREEFALIFKGLNNEQHGQLAVAKLERALEEPLEILGDTLKIQSQIGLAITDDLDLDSRELYKRGLASLAQAERTGVSCVAANDALGTELAEDWALGTELASALENGELVAYFQPKVHATYRSVVGSEALVRWHSPARGVVPPNRFIPAIEGSHLLKPLTWHMLKTSMGTCAQWPSDVGVAVNIPPMAVTTDELVTLIGDTLSIHDLAPERLTLEITERGFFEDPDRQFAILRELRSRGVRISIDDFGTGQSSLAHFRHIPADEIKIDRSFVAGMEREPDGPDRDIVRAIIDLAHNFSLKVVAEGVETAELADRLLELGCDVLQGFHFARPMPGAEFAAWIARHVGKDTR